METRVEKRRTWAPTTAGILEIIEGTFSVFAFLGLLIASIVVGTGSAWAGITENDFAPLAVGTVAGILGVIAVVVLAMAILELIGGIMALRRKNWGLSLAGAIAAAIPGNILGILAIIFLAISKDEFD